MPLIGGTAGESNIANLWKDHFSAIVNSVGSTDNRDQVINALRTVPGHNDVINVHELRQIMKGLKNNKAVGNDGIPFEVYKFASEQLLTMMSIFLSGCMLTGKLPNSLTRSDHTTSGVPRGGGGCGPHQAAHSWGRQPAGIFVYFILFSEREKKINMRHISGRHFLIFLSTEKNNK